MNKHFLAAAVAASALVGAAWAQAPGGGFDRLDANGDGKVTIAEAKAERAAAFDRMDADKDGVVTTAEIEGMRAKMAERMAEKAKKAGERRGGGRLMEADANKDGRLTKAEIDAAPLPMFDKLDANKDGAISQDEMPKRKGKGRG